jgi:UDP-glucuronate 4-epimerase
MNVLVTGCAGFIGFHVARQLMEMGHGVVGVDAMTSYYDPALKQARLNKLQERNSFVFVGCRVEDHEVVLKACENQAVDTIIHLAAQPGVRYSFEDPQSYVQANLVGSWHVLELARKLKPVHLMMASTSSIYGASPKVPFREEDKADEQISLYAATKKGMEAMSHSYSHLYDIPTTSFRFFTVYGPWGRPDMALFKFTRSILEGQPIEVYGDENVSRDFTYVDDLVQSVMKLMPLPPRKSAGELAPYRLVNIGGGQPVSLSRFIEIIEKNVGKSAIKIRKPLPPGDVTVTFASPDNLRALTGYVPETKLEVGVEHFVKWYREHYGV